MSQDTCYYVCVPLGNARCVIVKKMGRGSETIKIELKEAKKKKKKEKGIWKR